MTFPGDAEAERIRSVYGRRAARGLDARYDYWLPANLFIYQSRERVLLQALRPLLPLADARVLDAGCGDGGMLLDCLRYGAQLRDLYGVDLLPDRVARARERLPGAQIEVADVRRLPYDDGFFDLVMAFTLLSSLLEDGVRRQACAELARVTRPEGLIVVYDFWINPFNREARPLRRSQLRALFPGYAVDFLPATLAPPLTRLLAPLPGGRLACTALEMLPFARTHFLARIRRGP